MFHKATSPYCFISPRKRRTIQYATFIILILVAAACSIPISGPEANATPTTIALPRAIPGATDSPVSFTTTPTPTTTPTSEPTATAISATGMPSQEQIPRSDIEPLVTAPRLRDGLRFDSWSPGGEWIAYWIGERSEEFPAYLAFVAPGSGKLCPHEAVVAQNLWSGSITWQGDGSATVITSLGEEPLRGTPCQQFSLAEKRTVPEATGEISPDGRYRADTTVLEWEGQLAHSLTTITDTTTNQAVVTVRWGGSPHFAGSRGWLNEELYLIGPTVDQGVLYVSAPDGRAGSVVTDLLGLTATEEDHVWQVFHHADPDTGAYHLLLGRSNGLPLLLYHSQLDLVEELPFTRAWSFGKASPGSFSPDGQWLFIGDPTGEESSVETNYWLRRVAPPGSEAIKVAVGVGFGGLSPQGGKMAFYGPSQVHLYSFPGGQHLGRWRAPGYQLATHDWWSPDGQRLVAIGHPAASAPEALFVIEP